MVLTGLRNFCVFITLDVLLHREKYKFGGPNLALDCLGSGVPW